MPDTKISLFESETAARSAWNTVQTASAMLDMFDWSEVSKKMSHAHSVGHILDPTGYRSLIHNPNVESNVKIAEAVETFLVTLRQIKAEAEAGRG